MIIKKTIILSVLILITSCILIEKSFGLKMILTGDHSHSYDNNINLSTDRDDNPELHDLVTRINLGIGVKREAKTYSLDMMAHIYQALYLANHGLHNNSQDMTLNLQKMFSRNSRMRLNYVLFNYPEPQEFNDRFGSAIGRIGYISSRLNANYVKELNKRLAVTFQYQHMYNKFDSGTLETSNMHITGLLSEYYFSQNHMFGLSYHYAYTRYTPGLDYNTHTPGIRYRYRFTKQLFAEARTGIDIFHTSEQYDNIQPLFLLIIADDLDQNSTVNLTFTKRYSLRGNSSDVLDNWRVSGLANRRMWARLSGSGSIFFGRGSFEQTDMQIQLFGITFSLLYEFTENLNIYITNSYSNSKTWFENSYTGGYTNYRLTLGIRGEI